MEVYNVLNIPSDKLDELCGAKQPFVAKNGDNPLHGGAGGALDGLVEFSVRTTGAHDQADVPPLTVGRAKAEKLFSRSGEDGGSVKYYSCGNWVAARAALSEQGLLSARDAFFAPPMTVHSTSDFIVGETGAHTALRYDVAHRTFLYAFDGASTVTLAPPNRAEKLGVIKDYELLEFRSPRDPHTIPEKDVMRVNLVPGDTLYVPPYWFYSVQLGERTKVHLFQYYTALNVLSTVNHHALHQLQLNNIKLGYDSVNPIDFGPATTGVVDVVDVVNEVVNEVVDVVDVVPKKKQKKKQVVFKDGDSSELSTSQ